MASTWARRKTRISTPVATTTNAERQDGRAGHDLERNLSDAGWVSDKSPVDLQSKEMSKLYSWCFTRYVYFFCAIRKRRLPDSPEEDPLLFFLGEEGIDDKHTFFTRLYSVISPLEPPSWTREVNISQPWLSHALQLVWKGGGLFTIFLGLPPTPFNLAESAHMKPMNGVKWTT